MGNIDWDKLNRTFSVPMDFEQVLKQDIATYPTRYGFDHYKYSGVGGVPRISEILKMACDSNGLIDWASKVGQYKMETYKQNAMDVGSAVHEAVEVYLKTNENKVLEIANEYIGEDSKLLAQCETAFYNFLYWENHIKSNNIEVITLDIEKEVICPLYGGTIDWIIQVVFPGNITKRYIADFKTSKAISTNYLLQTEAYRLTWNWLDYYYGDGSNYINGIAIIRLDKFSSDVLDFIFIDDNSILDRLEYDVKSMVNWYYCNRDVITILKTLNARNDFEV